jgi:O-antigen ligase
MFSVASIPVDSSTKTGLPLPAWLALFIGCVVAPLYAYHSQPAANAYNQLLALMGWGATLICLARERPRIWGSAAVLALLLLFVAVRSSALVSGLSRVLADACLIGAALLVLLSGQGLGAAARRAWFNGICWALLAAGLLSLVVSVVQVFAPTLVDGYLVANSGKPGRATGNMRQPNQLASLLLWACVAATYLADQRRLKRKALPVVLFGLVFAVVLSASRTGLLGVLVLALWGLLDGKLARRVRHILLAAPLMYLAALGLAWAVSLVVGGTLGVEARLAEGASSPQRLVTLANAWELVKRNPWIGVGWGEFNLAWTMTPFPGRQQEWVGHTHNLVMQLVVELGLPLGLMITGLLTWSLWRAWRNSATASGTDAIVRRCAFMLVLLIGLHSQLEYPLWYAYFLLPTAFAFGVALGPVNPPLPKANDKQRLLSPVLVLAGLLLLAGSVFAWREYLRVVAIYVEPPDAAPLWDRIAVGQNTVFFASHGDFAAATVMQPGPETLAAAKRKAHYSVDGRLLIAWALSLHVTGDDDRARYVVQRLREFDAPVAAQWFAQCDAILPGAPRPFQCDPPQREYDWREMR